MRLRLDSFLFALTVAVAAAGGEKASTAQAEITAFAAVDLHAALTPAALADRLASSRVVFVGETHTRYDHHLNQLAVIRELHERDPRLAIGVEYFERRYQAEIDDYIEGRSSEREFLRATHYFRTWGYDYRLYAPILRYAREQHIPVRALNVSPSLPSTVAKVGIAGLTEAQRAALPQQMEPAGADYEARLRIAFEAHGEASPSDFQHFVEAQLVWDEGMAQSAAAYLEANPGRRMVILAGAGHIEFGSGIPARLARRTHLSYATVLSTTDDIDAGASDYLLLSPVRELPPAGALGVRLEDEDDGAGAGAGDGDGDGDGENTDGHCRIQSIRDDGAADEAGLERGQRLISVDGLAVSACADVRAALWDKRPGDRVRVEVQRKRRSKSPRAIEVELGTAGR
jgi:uncharacterized iron-regulated protein